jgi:hypothetical protein
MKQHGNLLDAHRAQALEQLGAEVQPRGRRRDGAVDTREHGLVALAVGGIGVAVDVGRQRHLAVGFQRLREIAAHDAHDALASSPCSTTSSPRQPSSVCSSAPTAAFFAGFASTRHAPSARGARATARSCRRSAAGRRAAPR